jgi:Ca2+-binding EF-hand superfamily protein
MSFEKIDADHDGWISFAQYLHWVKYFFAAAVYNGLEYYFEEDDMALDKGDGWIAPEITPVPSTTVVSGIVCPYKFSNYDLARRARAHLFLLLEKFDLNKNLTFEESEIINILKTLLKSDDLDIFYVVANVFRYDTDGDRRVTYDELVNFFLELHNGELAIQRLHKASSYVRGA